MIHVAEQERDVEYADIGYEIRKWSSGDESQVDRTQFHSLEHLNLATQGRVRILLNLVATVSTLRNLIGEDGSAGAKLRMCRQDIAKLQRLGSLRSCRDCCNAACKCDDSARQEARYFLPAALAMAEPVHGDLPENNDSLKCETHPFRDH